MKTSNFASNSNIIDKPTGKTSYLTVTYSEDGFLLINWFRQYGAVAAQFSGVSWNIIKITNFDNTTCDLYLPMSWVTTSTRKWNSIELPLKVSNISITSVAGPLNGGTDPAPEL